MPSLRASAISRRCMLQVPISVQVLAMPMMGLCRSSLLKPEPRRYEREAARSGPSVNGMLVACLQWSLSFLGARLVEYVVRGVSVGSREHSKFANC